MSDNGWISLYRKFTEWEWYTDANTMRVFVHLLLKANHKEGHWQGKVINKGELITSLDHLSKDLKLTPQQVRTALEKLKKTNEITTKATNKYTLVSIVKYSVYQDKEEKNNKQNNNQITNEQQTNNNQITTNNKNNNNNNIYYYLLNKYKSNDFPPSTSIIENVRKDPDYLLLDNDDRISLEMELML